MLGMPEKATFITTPIYYISGDPHIGHVYTTVAADVLRRTALTRGAAFLLTGTDEHGQKVAAAAALAGLSPREWTDRLVPRWKALSARFNVEYNDFIRTTEERHQRVVIAVFEQLKAQGEVYLGTYEGWYCTNDETFWLESKLIDGRCPNPECRREVQWISENAWFFALSRYRDRLLAHYRANPGWVRPQSVYHEMLNTIEAGLDDLCVSRSKVDWGVRLPDGSVMYVWLDALLNYISAVGYSVDDERFAHYWPADVQLVGKDIARFHAIIWPALLWALDLPAPRRIYAHGWLTVEGEKMSKSRGNVVDPFALADRFGPDAVRYFLLREAAFGSDFSYSEAKILQRYTSDLGNDLGNLLRRSLAMLARYRENAVPSVVESPIGEAFSDLGFRVHTAFSTLQFREGLEAIWELVTALNRLVDERKPWVLAKEGSEAELDAVLYELCEGLRWIALLIEPVMPSIAREMWRQLGLADEPIGSWEDELAWGGLATGTVTDPAEPLFPRLEEISQDD
jgi:methionyl-tRNA synthetase